MAILQKVLRGVWKATRTELLPATAILVYHRVCAVDRDPQLLCVSPKHFAEHVEVIERGCRIGNLATVMNPCPKEDNGRPRVIITFDDGYADNLYEAKAVLERFGVPAVFFVATGYLDCEQEFWWDELERLILEPKRLPRLVRVTLGEVVRQWIVEEDGDGDAPRWNILEQVDPKPRHGLYRSLCGLLRGAKDDERREVLCELRKSVGAENQVRQSHRMLRPEEVVKLSQGSLVEVGAHSVTHSLLSSLDRSEQWTEIFGSKRYLEELLGKRVDTFAYPYGSSSDYARETVRLVRQAGFLRACSNFPGKVTARTSRYELPRFLVRDWDGEEFSRQLHSFLSV